VHAILGVIDAWTNYQELENAADYTFINNDVIRVEVLDNGSNTKLNLYKNNILISQNIVPFNFESANPSYFISDKKSMLIRFTKVYDVDCGFNWIRIGRRSDKEINSTPNTGFGDDFGIF